MENLDDVVLWDGAILTTIILSVGLNSKVILPNNKLKWHKDNELEYLNLKEIAEQILELDVKIDDKDCKLKDVCSVITVIHETGLSGTIYQYGNYGPYWVEHGHTKGYA